jgi:hypothetical protein
VVDDLPFTTVESPILRDIVTILRNRVKVPSADILKNDIMLDYDKKKNKVRQYLQVIII